MTNLLSSTIVCRHKAAVKLISMSPNGELMATVDVDRLVRVWYEGEVIFQRSFIHPSDKLRALDVVRSVRFTPSGNQLVVAAAESVWIVDLMTGLTVFRYQAIPEFGFLETIVMDASVSRDGRIVASYGDGKIDIFHCGQTHTERLAQFYDNDTPALLGFLPDQRRFVGTDHVSLCVWDSVTGQKSVKVYDDDKIYGMAVSPLQDLVAVRTLRHLSLWDVSGKGSLVARIATLPGLPQVGFSSKAELMAFNDCDGVSIADYEGNLIGRFDVIDAVPICVAFNDELGQVLIGCSDGTVRSWNYRIEIPALDG